jgi:hypothetical protein
VSASIPRFSLSDMTAQQLAEEMVRRIPAHTPEWKNPLVGDPGRTLIDLVAWMGETILYRVNLLPRRQRLEFLRLLGLQLRAAEPARGLIAVSHKKPRGAAPAFVPEGARVEGPVPFETRGPVTAQPFEGRVYYTRGLEGTEADALQGVIEDLAELYGVEAAAPYVTTPLFADGRAVPGGIDPFTASVDRTVWIAILALDDSAAAQEAALAAFDAQPALLNVGVIPRMVTPDPDPAAPEPVPLEHFSWAISSSTRIGELVQDIFLPLQTQADTTHHMTREGTLRLVLPGRANVAPHVSDLDQDLDAGLGDRPPRIDDADILARLRGWLRLRPRDADGVLPLSWLGINAVAIDARETRRQIQIGTSNGRPAQVMKLPAGDVDPETFALSVQEGGRGFVRWYAGEEIAAMGRDDRFFTLDPAEGTVAFGDGLNGMLPEPGARVRVDQMRSGGGVAGNVAAGTLSAIEAAGLTASQPAAMSKGRAGEILEAAEKRVSAWLRHQDRCVTEADYRAIAGDLDLARVEVLPRFRPYQQRSDVAGVVSLLALPHKAVRQAPNPRPDRRLIEQVRAHLEPRRPIGTELFVIAPDYVKIGAAVAVNIREGFAEEEVVNALRAALYGFLWPLAGGGREGAGWPLGQAVMNLEVELIAARVPGVRTSAGASIFTMGPAGYVPVPQDPATGAQVLALEAWQLPELMQLDIAVGASAPPSSLTDSFAGSGGGTAIPVVPEVC